MTRLQIADFEIGEGCPLTVIAGPCMIESLEMCLETADYLKVVCKELGVPLIFNSSFDKANRTSIQSFRGPGLEVGLNILRSIKERCDLPVYTDIHTPEQAAPAAEVCVGLQIPAFLCRQTDLVVAAAQTGRVVGVKKGQFMAPWDMKAVAEKIRASGNEQILLIDRGTSFGYNNLVSDFRGLQIMKEVGRCPVVFDCTHSVQLPGGHGSHSGGQAEFIEPLTLAAVAAGADVLYLECHPNPPAAKSDAATQLRLDQVEPLLRKACSIRSVLQEHYVYA